MVFDNTTNVLVDGNVLLIKGHTARQAVGLYNGATATITNNWFRGALPARDYVTTDTTCRWVGGNNSTTDTAPSSTRWTASTTTTTGTEPTARTHVQTDGAAGDHDADEARS